MERLKPHTRDNGLRKAELRRSYYLELPAGEHFNLMGHEIKDMNFLPIERVHPAGDTELRKTRESVWIRRYDSVNFGNNIRA